MRRMSLLVLLTAIPGVTLADPGSWEQVGQAGAWKNTIAGTTLKGKMYTVETDGFLYATNLSNGEWKPLGKAEFGGTKFMFAAGDSLYTIENDGSLYKVDPADGSWGQLGDAGAWKGTLAGTIHKGKLYSTETNGALYETNLENGKWRQIGKADFGATTFMFAAGDHLCTIENDGSLYSVDPKDGSWGRLGDAGAWKGTLTGVTHKGRLYTTEDNGGLYETNTDNGVWKQLGKAEFGGAAFMFAAGENVYTLEKDGSLYRVFVK